jgi:hypothetical protein
MLRPKACKKGYVMSKKSRRVFSGTEKARVALAALREAQTVNEIAAEHKVHPISCTWIAPNTRDTDPHFEYAEISQFPTASLGKGFRYGLESALCDSGCVTLSHAQLIGHQRHQVSFGHSSH